MRAGSLQSSDLSSSTNIILNRTTSNSCQKFSSCYSFFSYVALDFTADTVI